MLAGNTPLSITRTLNLKTRCMSRPATYRRPVNAVFGSQIVPQDTNLRQENVTSYDTRFPPVACWFRAEFWPTRTGFAANQMAEASMYEPKARIERTAR